MGMGGCDHECGVLFFFQAEDGIRDLVRSRGLGDVYKRQAVASGPDERSTSSQSREPSTKVRSAGADRS